MNFFAESLRIELLHEIKTQTIVFNIPILGVTEMEKEKKGRPKAKHKLTTVYENDAEIHTSSMKMLSDPPVNPVNRI